jgi:hypothetical protein
VLQNYSNPSTPYVYPTINLTCQLVENKLLPSISYIRLCIQFLVPNDNVVDGNMHQLNKETNESHQDESSSNGLHNLQEFLFSRKYL